MVIISTGQIKSLAGGQIPKRAKVGSRVLNDSSSGNGEQRNTEEFKTDFPIEKIRVHYNYVPGFIEEALMSLLSSLLTQAKALTGRRCVSVRLDSAECPNELKLLGTELSRYGQRQTGNPEMPAFNHLLVNYYGYGYSGIMPHEDGPQYFPTTACLSLLGDDLMKFSPHSNSGDSRFSPFDVELPRRCLVLFAEEAYTSALHEIPFREWPHVDSYWPFHRVSLTFRHQFENDKDAVEVENSIIGY